MVVTTHCGRYYEKDMGQESFDRMVNMIETFNQYVPVMYNALYDKEYCKDAYKARVGDKTLSGWFIAKTGLNTYYENAIASYAGGVLQSQKALIPTYIAQAQDELERINEKAKQTVLELENKRKVKQSLAEYNMSGVFHAPYKNCGFKIKDKMVVWNSGKKEPVSAIEQERVVEKNIRRLKARIGQLKNAASRKAQQIHKLENDPPARAVFGSKAFYKKKDTVGVTPEWKKEFHARRNSRVVLPGRHTSKDGNFLCLLDKATMDLTVLPPGATRADTDKYIVFKELHLARYADEFVRQTARPPKPDPIRKLMQNLGVEPIDEGGIAICYSFTLKTDKKNGKRYIVPAVTFELPENRYLNCGFSTGVIGADLNVDHIAWADVGANGQMLASGVIPFDINGKSTGETKVILGTAVNQLAKICTARKKPLAIEDLDFEKKKNKAKYGNKDMNRMLSTFAYSTFQTLVTSQSYRKSFAVYVVNPAYTSFMSRLAAMRKYGVSVHEGAAYMIGLRAMGTDICSLVPEPLKSQMISELPTDILTYEQAINKLSAKLKKLDLHSYYHKNWKPDMTVSKMASAAVKIRKEERTRQRAKSLHPEFAKAM